MEIILDVKTREEYYMNHIKGSLNIPVWDLEFYLDFLKDKKVKVYCGIRRKRTEMALSYLKDKGIDVSELPVDSFDDYEWVGKNMVTAINYLSVKPGHEKKVEEMMEDLCQFTMDKKGFIGTKVVKTTNVAFGGSMLQGEYEEIEIKPTKYIMITYWDSVESHEEFHRIDKIMQGFKKMIPHLSIMPFEEYAEIQH
jgi:heme-degrading monooxygenase HmoA